MKITDVQAMRLTVPRQETRTPPRRPSWAQEAEVANPMSRYPKVKRHRNLWTPRWEAVWCKVTVEDGTWGIGQTTNGRVAAAIIDDHLGPQLVGEDCFAGDKLADMLFRLTKPYGSTGLAAYAVSAIDLAFWDVRGKLLGKPVYSLLGGPQKERLFCYATGNDVDWYQELGFRAFKLACPYGPADGWDGIRKNEELVARTREQIGPDVELMVDAWISLNVEHAVRLGEALRPYRIKWLEDYLLPEDMESYFRVRERLPGLTLASGEHWYTIHPFALAASRGLVDIMQPDLAWCGGISAGLRICHLAEAHGLTVITHGGMNYPWGQHLAMAMPAIPMGERSEGVAPPGVPLEEMTLLPGTVPIRDGRVRPTDAPGLGLEITREWLESKAV